MEKGNKKSAWMAAVLFIVLLCGMAACGKKQAEPNIPFQDLMTEYTLDNMNSFAALEDGTVYAVNCEVWAEEPDYKLHRFNAQGECEECIVLGKEYAMVDTLAMSEDEEVLYFTAQNDVYGIDLYLFAYSVADGSFTMLCDLSYFTSVKQVAVVGDVVYLLGKSPNWQSKEPPASGYSFAGERLVSYTPGTGEMAQLGFDFPINMAGSGTGTLMVSGYLDGTGYCLMEYDPEKDSMRVVSPMEEYKFDRFAVCNDGKDVIYGYFARRQGFSNERGIVLSEIGNLSVEAELFPGGECAFSQVLYVGGKVYCRDLYSAMLISFPLDAVRRQNKELSFITRESSWYETPYGCGYQMKRVILTDEKFTLKVLARDKDYDLCLGNTLKGDERNLRENGAFYPLNDVPGIEEYLERCFPYVREAATLEDGTIWMLPVQVEVSALLAKRAMLEEDGLALQENMTWEEYGKLLLRMTEEQRGRIVLTNHIAKIYFCEQYFSHYRTLEDGPFEKSVDTMSEIWNVDCGGKITVGNVLLDLLQDVYWMRPDGKEVPYWYGEDAVVVSLPKLAATDKNIASCSYLAVNPDSARRDEVLAYLADLIAYMMRGGGMPYFTDWERENAVDEAVYRLYENGEIAFGIDPDVYEEGLEELLSGTLPLEEYMRRTETKLKMYWGE